MISAPGEPVRVSPVRSRAMDTQKERVLITGASGRIGTAAAAKAQGLFV